ncbi:hypothetical protein B0H16DRAFT_1723713 [Mycena metata]|uniref:Uncharacterized protein n=1 Tax=Mycena metata TaxID=1033252 RepID=A0AAD7IZ53_9AGAR|nr:hypothetical protein B0H16DRAFT_1723713 [Mycena metata]
MRKNTASGLDTDGLEQLWVTERQLDQFTDLGHLLAAATDIVVADVSEVEFLLFSLDWVTLFAAHVSSELEPLEDKKLAGVDHGVLRNNAELGGVGFHHLELDCLHATADEEGVALADRSEIRLQVDVKDVATQTLDRVFKGQDVDALAVFYLETSVDIDEVAELDEVVTSNLFHFEYGPR